MKKVCFALVSLGAFSASYASDLSLDLNPDAFHARYDAHSSSDVMHYSLATIITDERGQLGSITARTEDTMRGNPSLSGGFGARGYYIDDEVLNYGALGIGGALTYEVPQSLGLVVSTELYYAPNILISEDLDNVVDLTIKVEYQIFDNSSLYLGYRRLRSEYEGETLEIDDGLHVGFTLHL